MTIKASIPIETLDEETRTRLGIKLPPSVEQLGDSLVTVGRVLQALKGLSYEDALKVLWHAERLLVRQAGPTVQQETGGTYVPTIERALQVASSVFEIDIAELKQYRRDQETVEARQAVMYILVMTNGYTYQQIGNALNRNGATVFYAFQKVARQLERRKNVRVERKVSEIWMRLYGKELRI